MSTILFSRQGIHFQSAERGDIVAIYVPVQEQVRTYTDIPQPSDKTVRERYGQTSSAPLWRLNGSTVEVYGTMPTHLMDKRQGMTVWLPQDYLPKDQDVFYYIFGNRWVVHGERRMSDDGKERWGISRIDAQEEGGVEGVIVTALSDRMLEGQSEKICIAVYKDDKLLKELQKPLKALGQKAVSFSSLQKPKGVKPLYIHRDYSLLMLTLALFSLLVLIAVMTFWILGQLKLENIQREIVRLEEQIRQQNANRPLGHIRNPAAVLKDMAQQSDQLPSGILHSGAEAAAAFGTLKRVQYWSRERSNDIIPVQAELEDVENDLLLYQEEVAKSVLRTRPWIRKIERVPGPGSALLKIEVQVK